MAGTLTATEYRLLVENSPVMVWRAGRDAKCDYFSESWLAFTGRTLEQEVGDGWVDGVLRDDVDRCVGHYLDHFNRREPFEMEYRLRRRDGVYRWILDRGVPFADERGVFAGFIGSCIDIDERRRAQESRAEHDQEQLALARDFHKRCLSIVSHDIRDPLGTIQLAASQLEHVAGSASAVDKQARKILRAVGRIQHIVGDLLDLSQEREGAGIPVSRKPTDLRVLCRQIVDELDSRARDRPITFDCDVDATGEWDEHRILQAISNLASNALQHGVPGTPVRIRLTGNDACVVAEVQNHGVIPDDIAPRLFEPFQSGREYDKRGHGVGLGLFIARAIARAHGGSLDFDSTAGATTFRLTLPRESARSPMNATERSATISS